MDVGHSARRAGRIRVIDSIVSTLGNHGFLRRGSVWNRRSEGFVEVVDLQISKSGDTFTINGGVLDVGAYQVLWGNDPPVFAVEPDCTVRERVGFLVGETDLWWPIDEGGPVGVEAAQTVSLHVLPFVSRMRSREAMVRQLTETQVEKLRYPLPAINLAILLHLLGNEREASDLLSRLRAKATGAWRGRVAEVVCRLKVIP